MAQLKAGTRLRSAVCNTEVMVVLAPSGDVELTCGGAPMIDIGTEPAGDATLSPDHSEGSQIGKRYVTEAADLEVLCTKPGEGEVQCHDADMPVQKPRKLPSSD